MNRGQNMIWSKAKAELNREYASALTLACDSGHGIDLYI